MAKIKTGKELAAACVDVATNHKTLYVLGAFGWPLNATMKKRAKDEYEYNRRPNRAAKIDAASADTFGSDCVCFIKSLLWGWNGDASAKYGGAVYQSNGVPDIDEAAMIDACSGVSTDFSTIQVGEAVWMPGHIGIYIGDGLAVECTPVWKDGVQITAVHNIGQKSGYNGRSWTKHGKLPYVTYDAAKPAEKPAQTPTAAPAEKKADYTLGMRYLRKGDQGSDVKALQILLKGNGYNLGTFGPKKDGIDSDFGGATDTAVRAYQKANGLEVDGVVGRATMASLMGV